VSAVGAQSNMQTDVKFTDAARPGSTISFPADGGSYKNATWTGSITGTAVASNSGGTLTVGVSIKRNSTNLYWNGSSFANAAETFITATGSTSWSLSFPATNFPGDDSYTVKSKAHDNGGDDNNPPTATFTIKNSTATPSAPVLTSGTNSGSN